MAIKVIVELQAKLGKRSALKHLIESIVTEHGSVERGFLGRTRYQWLVVNQNSTNAQFKGTWLRQLHLHDRGQGRQP